MTLQPDETDFARRLTRALEGEHFGEAMFTELARRRVVSEETEILEVLAALERSMAHALETLRDEAGIAPIDVASSRARGVAAAERFATRPWNEFLAEFAVGTSDALTGYAKLRAAAPKPNHPVLVLLTEHEVALREFGEVAQQTAVDPLTAVRRVLRRLQPGDE